MVNVQIVGVRVDPETGTSAILLGTDPEPEKVLPIVVGEAETRAIVSALVGLAPRRPGTHDLTISLLEATDSTLEEVAVTELMDGVFLAELFIEMPDGLRNISSRPSDGIALALRAGAPVVVARQLFDSVAVDVVRTEVDTQTHAISDQEIDRIVTEFQGMLATASAADFEPSNQAEPGGSGDINTQGDDSDQQDDGRDGEL